MGLFCSDPSTKFLRDLGYNTVRLPSASFRPFLLLGRQNDETQQLGMLSALVTSAPGPLPAVTVDEPAANISGQKTAKLDVGIGANILGTLVGAMGGNLGVNLDYTDARKVEFTYKDVTLDSAVPLEIGDYLRNGRVDAGNLILQQYVLGHGELYVVTKVARSRRFTVRYERQNGTEAAVDVPALQALAGAKVKVGAGAGSVSTIDFEGPTPLGFAFQCLQVGVANGALSLTTVKAGAVTAAVGAPDEPAALLQPEGLLDVR